MVLVDADRVKPAFGGEFELIHEVVVHQVRALRVEQRGMDVHPYRGMLLAEILRQFGIGHQVKPHQLHGRSSWIRSDHLGASFETTASRSPQDEVRSLCRPRQYLILRSAQKGRVSK